MADAMEHGGTSSRLPVARPALTRESVVDAAVRYVDEHGLARLTMRALGGELGVQAMSLYRYVNGREDLLEAMVDRLVQALHLHPGRQVHPEEGWQGYLQWLAHAVRGIAVEHPRIFPLVASRHPSAPWLRPPLRSLDVVEDFLHNLTLRGFGDEEAVAAYRAFSGFLLGSLLLEAAVRGSSTGPADEALDEGDGSVPNADGRGAGSTLADHPTIARLEGLLSQDRSDEEFELALEELLDRLDRMVSR